MTERMSAARERRDRRPSYHDAPSSHVPTPPPKRGSVGRTRPSGFQSSPVPPPSSTPSQPFNMPPHRPGSEHRQRSQPSQLRGGFAPSCGTPSRPAKEANSTRGMQSGFTFGGATSA